MTVSEDARGGTADGAQPTWVPAARAAQELALRRGEFDLAVHLGLIATGQVTGGGRPRVCVQEIERLRAQPGFPAALREKVRTVGTAEGASLLGITQVRFTGLARIGCVSPVAFYLNRYRAVVWVYLVGELVAFAAQEPGLLVGRIPAGMRAILDSGTDRRARNWRTRRIDRLLKQTRDPWVRAALEASALDPVQLAEVVDDPYERAYLTRMQHASAFGQPGSVSGREVMARLTLADDPDEILWRRVNLTLELDRARDVRPAPRPGEDSCRDADQRSRRQRDRVRTSSGHDVDLLNPVKGSYTTAAGRGTRPSKAIVGSAARNNHRPSSGPWSRTEDPRPDRVGERRAVKSVKRFACRRPCGHLGTHVDQRSHRRGLARHLAVLQ